MNSTYQFNGEKLRLARLLNGLTQQELGSEICVTRQFIHQLESDSRTPAPDVLNALCEILRVKADFFSIPLINDVKFEQCHFRKRKTTPVGVANRVLAFSTIFEELVAFAHENLDLPQTNFPKVNHTGNEYSFADIEKAARDCRKLWGLSDGPISSVTRALENAGVVITQFQGVSEKVDALSLNRKFPIVVRNDAKESTCRMRFDLAHECGHFVLHDGIETGDHVTEAEADTFASEFLFPHAAFVQEFPNFKGRQQLDWSYIYRLKVRWGMSARAIIYKAHKFNLITAQQFRWANVWLNKSGQSKKERYDADVKTETPELLFDIFDVLKNELGVSYHYLSNRLAIEPEMLEMITSIPVPDNDLYNNVIPLLGKSA